MKFIYVFLILNSNLFCSDSPSQVPYRLVVTLSRGRAIEVEGSSLKGVTALFHEVYGRLVSGSSDSAITRSAAIHSGLDLVAASAGLGHSQSRRDLAPAVESQAPDLNSLRRASSGSYDSDDQDFPRTRVSIADDLIDDSPVGLFDPQTN